MLLDIGDVCDLQRNIRPKNSLIKTIDWPSQIPDLSIVDNISARVND